MAKIIAVCKSKQKGTKKEALQEGHLRQDYGLTDDAHAGKHPHRGRGYYRQETFILQVGYLMQCQEVKGK